MKSANAAEKARPILGFNQPVLVFGWGWKVGSYALGFTKEGFEMFEVAAWDPVRLQTEPTGPGAEMVSSNSVRLQTAPTGSGK